MHTKVIVDVFKGGEVLEVVLLERWSNEFSRGRKGFPREPGNKGKLDKLTIK